VNTDKLRAIADELRFFMPMRVFADRDDSEAWLAARQKARRLTADLDALIDQMEREAAAPATTAPAAMYGSPERQAADLFRTFNIAWKPCPACGKTYDEHPQGPCRRRYTELDSIAWYEAITDARKRYAEGKAEVRAAEFQAGGVKAAVVAIAPATGEALLAGDLPAPLRAQLWRDAFDRLAGAAREVVKGALSPVIVTAHDGEPLSESHAAVPKALLARLDGASEGVRFESFAREVERREARRELRANLDTYARTKSLAAIWIDDLLAAVRIYLEAEEKAS
jgi:hypothetical protein